MSVKIISKDEAGKPKTYFFSDTCTCSINKPEPDQRDIDTTLSDEARERMIQRNKDAWKQ